MSLSPPHLALFSSSLSASDYCRSLYCSLLQDNFRCFLHLTFCASRLPESQECFSLIASRTSHENATKNFFPALSRCRLAYGTHKQQIKMFAVIQSVYSPSLALFSSFLAFFMIYKFLASATAHFWIIHVLHANKTELKFLLHFFSFVMANLTMDCAPVWLGVHLDVFIFVVVSPLFSSAVVSHFCVRVSDFSP